MREDDVPAIHICRVHTIRFLFDAIERLYDDNDSREFKMKKWLYPFIYSRSIGAICRRIHDVVLIAGSKYKSIGVERAIANIAISTKKIGTFFVVINTAYKFIDFSMYLDLSILRT